MRIMDMSPGQSLMNVEDIAAHTLPPVLFRFIVSAVAPLGREHQAIFFKSSDIFAMPNRDGPI